MTLWPGLHASICHNFETAWIWIRINECGVPRTVESRQPTPWQAASRHERAACIASTDGPYLASAEPGGN